MSYNGWTNRETWLVNVWFNPESKSQLESIKDQIESDVSTLPDYLKDFVDTDRINWTELEQYHQEEDEAESELIDLETFKRSI
jgi:hypothetical protein